MVPESKLDLSERLAPQVSPWLTGIAIGLLCACGALFVRQLIDLVFPGGAPFALVFPAAMIATLYGRWIAGTACAAVLVLVTWFALYPVRWSFVFADAAGPLAIGSVTVSCIITVVVAETFARSVRRAHAERNRQIAERDLYLSEFEHRVKNNFAVVASLLDMQRRRSSDPSTQEALAEALGRIDSIARAHRHLYRTGQHDRVNMADYLRELCSALSESLFLRGAILLECDAEPVGMNRDRAVPIGLIINELVTNAAKHAFAGRDSGIIRVAFRAIPGGWRLSVADDGVGIPEIPRSPNPDGGLGRRLIDAFSRQAKGTMVTDSDAAGTIVTVDFPEQP